MGLPLRSGGWPRRVRGLLVLAITCSGCEPAQVTNAARTSDPPRPRFDGGSALARVERQLAFGPRVPGTEPHRAMARWLEDYLSGRAGHVEVQRFSHVTVEGAELQLFNFWAWFNRSGARPLLFVAHWDTRPISDRAASPSERAQPVPGANDGASGTAILLELADLMHRHPPPRAVDLLLVDGEDYGDFRVGRDVLLGSRHFATRRPAGYDPRYAVLLDMVGDRDLTLYVEGHSQRLAPDVVARVWNTAARLGLGHVFRRTVRHAVEDDHIPLNEAGIPSIAVIDLDYAYWHTPQDTLDKVSAASLEAVGRVIVELIYGTE